MQEGVSIRLLTRNFLKLNFKLSRIQLKTFSFIPNQWQSPDASFPSLRPWRRRQKSPPKRR